jgi:pimeloyl-ACP methyl ester carboxylesterase
MELHYKAYGEPSSKSIIILHGLFGLGDNWVSIARKLSSQYYVVVPDHRNHGLSPHTNDFSLSLMASDVKMLMESLGLSKPVVLGHSMGGKVAMHFALEYPDLISGLIVADISTKESYVRPEHQQIIDQFSELPLDSFSSLQEIQNHLITHLPSPKLAFMVLKNIKRKGDTFLWKLNVQGILNNISSIMQSIESDESYMNAVSFIKGGDSDYILEEDVAELQKNFPFAEVKTIKKASHWLHADNPEAFLMYVNEYLQLIRY